MRESIEKYVIQTVRVRGPFEITVSVECYQIFGVNMKMYGAINRTSVSASSLNEFNNEPHRVTTSGGFLFTFHR